MNKILLSVFVLLTLFMIALVIYLNLYVTETINFKNIKIEIKHPMVYKFKELSVKQPNKNNVSKAYTIEAKYDLSSMLLFIYEDCKYSPEDFVKIRAKSMGKMMYYSANKNKSEVHAGIKGDESYTFLRMIKIDNYTILITAKDYSLSGAKNHPKKTDIVKDIKISEVKK